jgi:hypothetical protein
MHKSKNIFTSGFNKEDNIMFSGDYVVFTKGKGSPLLALYRGKSLVTKITKIDINTPTATAAPHFHNQTPEITTMAKGILVISGCLWQQGFNLLRK